MSAGVSLFLYRVMPNPFNRTPGGRVTVDGKQRYRNQLPIDLRFILTAWGRTASLQYTIAGWMMRVLEDNPILHSGLLNNRFSGVFNSNESVEISLGDLSEEDMLRLWETMVDHRYQLSVPYLARNIWIESKELLTSGALVQERRFDYSPGVEEEEE